MLIFIDADMPEAWLLPALSDTFATAFELTFHTESEGYVVDDSVHIKLLGSSPVFKFTIGTSATGEETIEIEIPYAAFDLQATYPIFSNATNYFPLRKALDSSQIALGRAFLQEVYMIVDGERDAFNISQAVFKAPMPEPDIVTIRLKDTKDSL